MTTIQIIKGTMLASSLALLLLAAEMAQAQEMPVLTTAVKRGDIISEDILTYVPLEDTRVNPQLVEQATDIVGRQATRNLRPGFPLYHRQFRDVPVVERGGKITIVYQKGGVRLTTEGTAMSDAHAGDWIKVMNPASKRMLDGQVQSNGFVVIN